MCSWERFCTFAREPEKRTVGDDARVSIDGVEYEVDPELAGETVMLWWGLFDEELFVEHGGRRHGPYSPSRGALAKVLCSSGSGNACRQWERLRAPVQNRFHQ